MQSIERSGLVCLNLVAYRLAKFTYWAIHTGNDLGIALNTVLSAGDNVAGTTI